MSNLRDIKRTMLVSPNKVKEYAVVGLNLDENGLGNAIRISHIYLRDVIGNALVEHLQELVYNKIQGSGSTIDDPENEKYKVLLDEYVVPTLVYRSAEEACTISSLKIRSMGVVKNSDINVNDADSGDVSQLTEYYGVFFNDALNEMMEFLCENKEAFTELPDGFCTCSSKPLYAQTNLWLGPNRR